MAKATQLYINKRDQLSKGGIFKSKNILTLKLSDGVSPIYDWFEVVMEVYKFFFLQVQSYIFTNLEHVWDLMLIVSPLVLGWPLVKYQEFVVGCDGPIQKNCFFIYLILSMGGIFLHGCMSFRVNG
jgi:hypothetical protein